MKFTSECLNLLLFGCYCPCNDHANDYVNRIAKVFVYIESVCKLYPSFKFCILGDLNFYNFIHIHSKLKRHLFLKSFPP